MGQNWVWVFMWMFSVSPCSGSEASCWVARHKTFQGIWGSWNTSTTSVPMLSRFSSSLALSGQQHTPLLCSVPREKHCFGTGQTNFSLCQCPPQQTGLSTETLCISNNSCVKHLIFIGLFQFFGTFAFPLKKELPGKIHSHENLSCDTSLPALCRTKIFQHSFVILYSWMENTFVTKWISSVKFLNDRSFFLCINSSHSVRLKCSCLFVYSGPGSNACLCISY